ncbi:para-aminobenzoate synthetase component 1/para-aminobenzoate synthetase/4-amino-4-deoxychorismate lyase [Delftia sp. 60]|uniref:aminodeoxychorismate synthase component I n=1 Tax=Delftia sp. 60 TaxID=2035216 RepID=UPI000C17E4BD|nr:aminodeoxychorismate synthase component I [Delftia sp. 60]PIF39395.1 para-aminobenzoate synthetase component 1/para-aminobenzoate synthetase/4-amino-4-deoxychorismate lyase [Burkholderiales bacterium 23]PIF65425.1 para-aminobenzoate synthetase component 1/para-aminobenzoate synthetase/4-amino-4-deoxychorismate lyase [Delftia sp. 60]
MKFLIDFPNPHDGSAARLRHGFGPPLRSLAAHAPEQVRGVLDAVQQAAQAGLWCLGWVRYEAAAAFDAAYAGALHATPQGEPLAWFAVFDGPRPWPEDADAVDAGPQAQSQVQSQVQWQPGLERADFDAAIARIHEAIAAGDCYQINYTAQFMGRLLGDIPSLFAALRRAQPGGYVACMDSGDEQVLSVSPELFFDWDGERILTRPMKGTAPRGATPAQDEANVQAMRSSPKERAENVMIVDLLRNDVSRIAEPFSVQVPRLFHAEPLPTVWQMTSDVQARTRPGTGLADVFAALFPCGSITGAPKRQAMRLIHELEPGPRGVYCGAVGVVRPGIAAGRVHATFNVPIRTVVARGTELRCGIGSGITSGAEAPAEWQEWRHKRAFLDKV